MFKAFGIGLFVATVDILTRYVFRVVELREELLRNTWNNELLFTVLEGAMVCLASLLLSILHPGVAFDDQWAVSKCSFKAKWRCPFFTLALCAI